MERNPYPGDVSDAEWAFVAPYLALIREDTPQREHPLHEVFNGLRYIVHTWSSGARCPTTHCTQCILRRNAGVFETRVHDLRMLLRGLAGRSL